MFRKVKGLFVIILVLSLCGFSSAAEKELESNGFIGALEVQAEMPLPEANITENSTDNEVLIGYTQQHYNDHLTLPEVLCMADYYEEQLNHTQSTFNYHLFTDYLRNSSEHPISSIGLTARELYNQSPGVHDFIGKMLSLTAKYSILDRKAKIEFLRNKVCNDELTNSILGNATNNEINYLNVHHAFDGLSEIKEYDNDTANFVGEGYNYKDSVEKAIAKFNSDVYATHLDFLLDGAPVTIDDAFNVNSTIDLLTGVQGNIKYSQSTIKHAGTGILVGGVLTMVMGGALMGWSTSYIESPLKEAIKATFKALGGIVEGQAMFYVGDLSNPEIIIAPDTTSPPINSKLLCHGPRNNIKDDDINGFLPSSQQGTFKKTNLASLIIGSIALAIGVILVGIGIWLLVFALVTLEKLIVRVGEFINMFKNMSDSLNN
jgi:hypothetical protein